MYIPDQLQLYSMMWLLTSGTQWVPGVVAAQVDVRCGTALAPFRTT